MPTVTKINTVKPVSVRKLRTAAYSRVSTDDPTQLLSLENQKSHYERLIKSNTDWEYAGLFYDEALTGTKMDNREGLKHLLRECEMRRINFIITKSISRLARNTAGCLEMVRRLKELNIAVFFEKEGINTGTMDGELLLTVLSGLAENESVSISENSIWSVKSRMRNGTYKLSKAPYGYSISDGMLTPNPEQAEVVRRIFAEFLSGKGYQAIVNSLNLSGFKPMRGARWVPWSIHWMLVNERYVGDVLLRKSYSRSFKRKLNRGEEDQYYIRDHHEPIISREDFERVQEIMERRRQEYNSEKGSAKYTQRYEFSGKIICGSCGGKFKRFMRKSKTCGLAVNWSCENKQLSRNKICSVPLLQDEAIKEAFVKLLKRLYEEKDVLLKPHIQRLKETADNADGGGRDKRLAELEKLIIENAERAQVLTGFKAKGYLTPALFTEQMNVLQSEAAKFREEKNALAAQSSEQNAELSETEALLKYLQKHGGDIASFDGEVFTAFVDTITVYSHDEVGFNLKCGLEFHETAVRVLRTKCGTKPTIPWDETKWAKKTKKGADSNGSGGSERQERVGDTGKGAE